MMTCKFVGVFVTVTLRGAPLLEPPDRKIDWDILDVVLGDEHQGKICGSVTYLYKGAGLRVFAKVNLILDFLVLVRILCHLWVDLKKGEKPLTLTWWFKTEKQIDVNVCWYKDYTTVTYAETCKARTRPTNRNKYWCDRRIEGRRPIIIRRRPESQNYIFI